MNNKARYAIIMIFGIVLDKVLFSAASALNLPVWLDVTGTALAALMLEPAAGLLVGLFNNFYLAIFQYDASTLVYYAVSAAVALIVGVNMRHGGVIKWKLAVPTIALVIVVSTVLSTALTLWRGGGIPTLAAEITYYQQVLAMGLPSQAACFIGIFIVKIYDTVAVAALIGLIYRLLPNALRYPPKQKIEA